MFKIFLNFIKKLIKEQVEWTSKSDGNMEIDMVFNDDVKCVKGAFLTRVRPEMIRILIDL